MIFSRSAGVVLSFACLIGTAVAASKPAAQPSVHAPEHAPALASATIWGMADAGFRSRPVQIPRPRILPTPQCSRNIASRIWRSATYTRDDGRTLKIRAARFADASGAFGAYTFYLQRQMTKEKIDDQGASLGQRMLFYRGHILVDAQFSQESAMSGAQLRELAGMLPRPSGSSGNLPTFIEFMPHRDYIANTQKYVMGPAALAAQAPAVSADLVDFNSSSEVSLARYSTPSGEATLMLISYPTPQLAAEHLRRIEAAHQMTQPQAGTSGVESAGNVLRQAQRSRWSQSQPEAFPTAMRSLCWAW